MPFYPNPNINGLLSVASNNDGYAINLKWATAYSDNKSSKIAYNIYFSTEDDFTIPENLFRNYPTFVSIDGSKKANILDLTPGVKYFFAVRAVNYPIATDLTVLPTIFDKLKLYPTSLLKTNIDDITLTIPLIDTENFPSIGIIRIGEELIRYTSINQSLNTINAVERGFQESLITFHDTDGYDGYTIRNPNVIYYIGTEEYNTKVFSCENKFDFPNYSFTITDGYRQRTKDILTTDLSGSDAFNEDSPPYDLSGYHATSPLDLLAGGCINSYIGNITGCADGYGNVGQTIRGTSIQDMNNQRQEQLLDVTGEPVCLFKKRHTGILCNCYVPNSEYPDDRCRVCMGTGFVVGWEQFFNPRRSDGRILVRFSPTDEDLQTTDAGLENNFITDCWTATYPTVKDRDFIIRFDEDDNEEFRYELLSVNRNKTFNRLQGAQKFKAQRVRKTDPIYQVRSFRNTQFLPTTIQTSISSSIGFPPHQHALIINENITDITQINQITSVVLGHSHTVINGKILGDEVVKDGGLSIGHSHDIIL